MGRAECWLKETTYSGDVPTAIRGICLFQWHFRYDWKGLQKKLNIILLGDLNYNYVVNESLHANPVHYIGTLYDMSQLITEKTRVV